MGVGWWTVCVCVCVVQLLVAVCFCGVCFSHRLRSFASLSAALLSPPTITNHAIHHNPPPVVEHVRHGGTAARDGASFVSEPHMSTFGLDPAQSEAEAATPPRRRWPCHILRVHDKVVDAQHLLSIPRGHVWPLSLAQATRDGAVLARLLPLPPRGALHATPVQVVDAAATVAAAASGALTAQTRSQVEEGVSASSPRNPLRAGGATAAVGVRSESAFHPPVPAPAITPSAVPPAPGFHSPLPLQHAHHVPPLPQALPQALPLPPRCLALALRTIVHTLHLPQQVPRDQPLSLEPVPAARSGAVSTRTPSNTVLHNRMGGGPQSTPPTPASSPLDARATGRASAGASTSASGRDSGGPGNGATPPSNPPKPVFSITRYRDLQQQHPPRSPCAVASPAHSRAGGTPIASPMSWTAARSPAAGGRLGGTPTASSPGSRSPVNLTGRSGVAPSSSSSEARRGGSVRQALASRLGVEADVVLIGAPTLNRPPSIRGAVDAGGLLGGARAFGGAVLFAMFCFVLFCFVCDFFGRHG